MTGVCDYTQKEGPSLSLGSAPNLESGSEVTDLHRNSDPVSSSRNRLTHSNDREVVWSNPDLRITFVGDLGIPFKIVFFFREV